MVLGSGHLCPDRAGRARGDPLAHPLRGPPAVPADLRAQRPGPGDDPPARPGHQAGDVTSPTATHLDGDRGCGVRRSADPAQGPPGAAALSLYLTFLAGMLILMMPLLPVIGFENHGARIWIKVQPFQLPARRAGQDRADGRVRVLPGGEEGRAGAGRCPVPRHRPAPSA